jgi:hypothetical protein
MILLQIFLCIYRLKRKANLKRVPLSSYADPLVQSFVELTSLEITFRTDIKYEGCLKSIHISSNSSNSKLTTMVD